MECPLPVLKLVLGACLALGLFSAQTASAAEFHAGAAPITLTGATSKHILTFSAGTVACNSITLTGEMPVQTTKQITLKPTFVGCTAFGFFNVLVDVNGCDFLYTATGEMHIVCASGKAIEITAPFCTVKVGAQNNLKGNGLASNAGETDVVMTTNIGGITYDECGVVRANGTYTGTTTVTGANAMKTPIDVWFK